MAPVCGGHRVLGEQSRTLVPRMGLYCHGLLILPRREDGPVAVIASSLNSLSDAMNRKSIELRAQRELQKERQDEEASKAEVERMTKLILARASHQSPNHASAQPSNPMFPESSSPVFGKRR